jgi:large subunit ribosomal protein L4
MKVAVYNKNGEHTGEMELNPDVFGIALKEPVIHQVYTALRANARQPWADTKDKSEVRGGGKKPWRQKGTGRARHGSIRSPLWKGGGVTFGPLSIRNYKQKINKKMNQQSVKMCLSDKVKNGKLLIVESFENNGKTKSVFDMLKKMPGFGRKIIVLLNKNDESLSRSVKNIPKINLKKAVDVNVIDLLHNQYVFLAKDGIKPLEKRLV